MPLAFPPHNNSESVTMLDGGGGGGGGAHPWGMVSVSGAGVTGQPSWVHLQCDLVDAALRLLSDDRSEEVATLPLAAHSFQRLQGVPDGAGCIQIEPTSGQPSSSTTKGAAWLRLPTRHAPQPTRCGSCRCVST